ncbi:hypothetical protein WJX77_011101 [Trebouxia sp. C0004]
MSSPSVNFTRMAASQTDHGVLRKGGAQAAEGTRSTGEGQRAMLGEHPNILTLVTTCEDEEFIYILHDYHKQGVCHRNISGDTVWLKDSAGEAEIRLGCFVDSEVCKTGQHISTRAGHINYLAPEVFVGHSALPVDIWACAAVFYRLLSGHFPFGGESESSIAAAIMDQDKRPEFSSAPWDEINSDAKHALTLMFACKVRDRPMAWQALEHPWFSELYPDVSVPHVMQATGPTSRNSERPAARGRSKSAKHGNVRKMRRHRLSGGYQLLACEDQYARLSMLSSTAVQSDAPAFRSNVTFLELAPSFSGPYSPEGRAPLQSPARLAALNGSSEGNRTNSAGKQAGQPATAHSNIQEHSAPSFVEAASVTRDLVNVISPFKPEAAKQARLHGASQTTVPRFLSPGSKALTGQAVLTSCMIMQTAQLLQKTIWQSCTETRNQLIQLPYQTVGGAEPATGARLKASEQASNTNPSKGPVAQGNGSSAAVYRSSAPSATISVTPTRTHASDSAAAFGKGFPGLDTAFTRMTGALKGTKIHPSLCTARVSLSLIDWISDTLSQEYM